MESELVIVFCWRHFAYYQLMCFFGHGSLYCQMELHPHKWQRSIKYVILLDVKPLTYWTVGTLGPLYVNSKNPKGNRVSPVLLVK